MCEHVYTRDSLACCLPPLPVVLASTRDTVFHTYIYVCTYTRLFNGTVADRLLPSNIKNLSSPTPLSPNPGKPHRVFSPDSERLFYGTLRQLPWEEFDRFVATANTEFPNVRLRFDFWGEDVRARGREDPRHDGGGRE